MAGTTMRETRGEGGWREIAVERDGKLLAVVTRPRSGARWFLHRMGDGKAMGEPFRTRKAALTAAC